MIINETEMQEYVRTTDRNIYNRVLTQLEEPLLRAVMRKTRYNQSLAAKVLGLSRGTLRTKLKQYFDDEFVGTRVDGNRL